MARVKRGVTKRARHQKVLKAAKGYGLEARGFILAARQGDAEAVRPVIPAVERVQPGGATELAAAQDNG